MKRIFFISVILFLFTACHEKAGVSSAHLLSMKLKAADNSIVDFSFIKNNKASVFVFLATDCPLSQNYSLTLNNLNGQFKNDSISFYGVIPGNNVLKKDVDEFINTYKINFLMLLDSNLILTNYFKATKTPEIFVVNAAGNILYKGAIDNWASSLGVHRKTISQHYLLDALSNIKQNAAVNLKETKAVGCFIERNS